MKVLLFAFTFASLSTGSPTPASAQPGTLLGTVDLPGNGACSVAGTFDGTRYITVNTDECIGQTLGIYAPPPAGTGAATLMSTKSVVDAANNPVTISALAWDPSRNMLWAGENTGAGNVYLVDIGDPDVSGDAVASPQFQPNVGGIELVDGMAYDASDDTLYFSPDVDCNVYHFSPSGTLLNTVTPKNAAGDSDCQVSGVVVGSDDTLYIGRDGESEIRRVHKVTGDFVSAFATTSGRVEDLTCDPITYAPKEAVLAKDAYESLYEAFEVEPGTCPLVGELEGRMTGGGRVFTDDGTRVTHGFGLRCDEADLPNTLRVNWSGARFHLETLDSASCRDDPTIEEAPPVAGLDTYEGKGIGRCNGEPAMATWTFTDAGEPGTSDTAKIEISGGCTLSVSGELHRGNHQAHPA